MHKRARNRTDARAPPARPDHARDHYPGWGFSCLSEAQGSHYQQPIYIWSSGFPITRGSPSQRCHLVQPHQAREAINTPLGCQGLGFIRGSDGSLGCASGGDPRGERRWRPEVGDRRRCSRGGWESGGGTPLRPSDGVTPEADGQVVRTLPKRASGGSAP
jgi:hypothetical protein